MRWLLVALPLLVFTSCSSAQCSQSNCNGCCDSSGACVAGTEQNACGFSGAVCSECNTAQFCASGACFTRTVPMDGGEDVDAGLDAGVDAGSRPDAGSIDAGPADAGLDAGTPIDAGTLITRYPDGGSVSAFWDGGSCAVKTDCPCFSSDDCAPDFKCVSEDATGENIYCVPGVRGPGVPGDACTGEADCFSALCIDSDTAGMKCSGLCGGASECPSSLPRCIAIPFGPSAPICSPP